MILATSALFAFLAFNFWNVSKNDRAVLVLGSTVGFGSFIFWHGHLIEASNGFTASIALLFSPMVFYVVGVILFVQTFFTKLKWWMRIVYLFTGLAALSPIIGLFLIIPLMYMYR